MWIRVCRSVVLGKFRWNHSICPCVVLFPSQAKFLGSIAFSVHLCMLNAELSCFISSAQGPGHRKYRTFMTFIYIRIHKYTYIYVPFSLDLIQIASLRIFPGAGNIGHIYTHVYINLHIYTYIYMYPSLLIWYKLLPSGYSQEQEI